MASIIIRTPGFWPLPKFLRINCCGKWARLKLLDAFGEKEAAYSSAAKISYSPLFPVILEASITKALPKKIHLYLAKRKIVLSRWIGGIYSNLKASSSQKQVRMFYDSIACIYGFHIEPARKNQLLSLFLAISQYLPKNSKVLDASAGNCMLAKIAKEKRPDIDIWCQDISAKMLKLGQIDGKIPSSRIVVSSASSIPFPPSTFDAIVHTFSNLHPHDRKFFRSFYRALKPGGLLLYHPVKAPGEQWPKNMAQKTIDSLSDAGFSKIERKAVYAKGKKKSTLVFYLAIKK